MLEAETSAADLKSLTHSRRNRVQGLQIESGTGIMDLPVPMTFPKFVTGSAAMEHERRKAGTSDDADSIAPDRSRYKLRLC